MPGVYYLEGGIYHPRVFLGGNVLLKRCPRCEQWKSKLEFHKNKGNKDGLCRYYKQCRIEYCQKNREQNLTRTREWWKKHPEGRKEYGKKRAKERGLGYNPLNEPFEGSVGHHINNVDVVFIPKEVHKKSIIKAHRRVILEHYGSIERMIENKPI